jgi:hypothetical protein
MLKSTRKANGDYSVLYNDVEHTIYKDSTGFWVAESNEKFICESKTKADLLDKLDDILRFG